MTDERVVESLKRSARKLGYHIEMTQDRTKFLLIDEWPGKARHNGDAIPWLTLDQTRAKLVGIGKPNRRGKK
jgi:hypothetical protein